MPNLKLKSGFSLVEILISLLFIGTLVTIMFTSTGSLLVRRQSNQQALAAKAATKEIERLRGLSFATLKTQGDLVGGSCQTSAQNPNLNNLKNGRLCRNLYDYTIGSGSNPGANTTIVGVTIEIKRDTDNEVAAPSLYMDTLIYQTGISY